jgi:antitoxin HicB
MAITLATLEMYLARAYPFTVHADPECGYVVVFPDLPGCMTQVDTLDEIGPMAEEARRLWIETEYEQGHPIPNPASQDDPSGKFVVRIPRSLHRSLAEAATRENVSLNQYVCTILARGDAQSRVETKLDAIRSQVERATFPGSAASR